MMKNITNGCVYVLLTRVSSFTIFSVGMREEAFSSSLWFMTTCILHIVNSREGWGMRREQCVTLIFDVTSEFCSWKVYRILIILGLSNCCCVHVNYYGYRNSFRVRWLCVSKVKK
jgi:hypothetical protein